MISQSNVDDKNRSTLGLSKHVFIPESMFMPTLASGTIEECKKAMELVQKLSSDIFQAGQNTLGMLHKFFFHMLLSHVLKLYKLTQQTIKC